MSKTDKSSRAEAKRLKQLQAQLEQREKKLSDAESKLRKKKAEMAQAQKKLTTDQKNLKIAQSQLAKEKRELRASASSGPSRRSAAPGGGKNSAKYQKLEKEYHDAKQKLNHFMKEARESKKKVNAQTDRIKLLERKLKNAQAGRKVKGNDKRVRQLQRENKVLRKKLRMLIKELNKKRKWYDRVIKVFKGNQDKWVAKQRSAFKDKKIIIKYVFLDDVKKLKVYQRGKEKTKFLRRVRVRTKGGGERIVKNVEVVLADPSELDADDDEDGAGGGGSGSPGGASGKGKKKRRKKGKKRLSQAEDEMESYLADLFKEDGPVSEDDDPGSDGETLADLEDINEDDDMKGDGSDDDLDDEDVLELKQQVRALTGELTDRCDDLKRIQFLFNFNGGGGSGSGSGGSNASGDGDEDAKGDGGSGDEDGNEDGSGGGYGGGKTGLKLDGDANLAETGLDALKKAVEAGNEMESLLKEIQSRQSSVNDTLGDAGYDFEKSPNPRDVSKQWFLLFSNQSKLYGTLRAGFIRAMATIDAYSRELEGRLTDLNTINEVYFTGNDDDSRKKGLNELNSSVTDRHESVSTDLQGLFEAISESTSVEATQMNEKIAKLSENLSGNNQQWKASIDSTETDFGESISTRVNLLGNLVKRGRELSALMDLIGQMPSKSIDIDSALSSAAAGQENDGGSGDEDEKDDDGNGGSDDEDADGNPSEQVDEF